MLALSEFIGEGKTDLTLLQRVNYNCAKCCEEYWVGAEINYKQVSARARKVKQFPRRRNTYTEMSRVEIEVYHKRNKGKEFGNGLAHYSKSYTQKK